MKKTWILIVVLLVIAAGAYLGRHKLKAMFMGPQQAPMQVAIATPTPMSSTSANNIYMAKTDSAKGSYLTDFQGMTVYTYDKDTAGVSNCTGGCAKAWPPYTSGATAQGSFPANITVITRTDGTKQFAWKGMPLYYYASDTKAGDITGDGIGGVWHIVNP